MREGQAYIQWRNRDADDEPWGDGGGSQVCGCSECRDRQVTPGEPFVYRHYEVIKPGSVVSVAQCDAVWSSVNGAVSEGEAERNMVVHMTYNGWLVGIIWNVCCFTIIWKCSYVICWTWSWSFTSL